MMARIRLERLDADTHGIFEGPSKLGWLRGDALGFVGFEDYSQARRAGELAATVLAAWYAGRASSRPAELREPAFPDAELAIGRVVAGRILSPDAVPRDLAAGDTFGFEFAVPPGIWVAVRLELAQRVRQELAVAGLLPHGDGRMTEVVA